jgi:hypothetical protein
MPEGKELIYMCKDKDAHIYHVTKVAAAREMRAIYASSAATIEDHLYESDFL